MARYGEIGLKLFSADFALSYRAPPRRGIGVGGMGAALLIITSFCTTALHKYSRFGGTRARAPRDV